MKPLPAVGLGELLPCWRRFLLAPAAVNTTAPQSHQRSSAAAAAVRAPPLIRKCSTAAASARPARGPTGTPHSAATGPCPTPITTNVDSTHQSTCRAGLEGCRAGPAGVRGAVHLASGHTSGWCVSRGYNSH